MCLFVLSSPQASDKRQVVDVTEQDESYTNLPSATASDSTWLDNKLEAVSDSQAMSLPSTVKSF